MAVAGLQGGSAKHARCRVRARTRTFFGVTRRGTRPDHGEARTDEVVPGRIRGTRAHATATRSEGSSNTADDESVPPVPHQMATAPAPGTRDWEPGAGRVLLATRCARHALPPTRRATPRHTTASPPPSAPPRGNDAASSSGNTAPSVTCESSIPSPLRCSPSTSRVFKDLYRNS